MIGGTINDILINDGYDHMRSGAYVMAFGAVLGRTVERFADRDALVFPACDYRLSYGKFADEVDRAARGLLALGIQPGEHVALWATNVPEWVILQFATARIGAVLVTVNPAYRPFELQYVLKQSDVVAMFLVERFKKSNYFEMLAEICPELAETTGGDINSAAYPKLRRVVALADEAPAGAITWSDMCRRGETVDSEAVESIAATLNAADPINIQYTSGTTGFPKAAMLSHRNLLLNAYYIGEAQRMSEHDRICIP
ncbi:MAG: AMP-binding protein, partial [Proteobacteria bacterium]|nr:AMP-binding protein [Pseudomonadota bacterium]